MPNVTPLAALALSCGVMAFVSLVRARRGAAAVFGIIAIASIAMTLVLSYVPHSV